MWRLYPGDEGIIAARGVHGQTIHVDPSAEMVVARFASFPKAQNPLIDPTSFPAFRARARQIYFSFSNGLRDMTGEALFVGGTLNAFRSRGADSPRWQQTNRPPF